MKKLICILLSAVILFTLVSCGSAEPRSSGEIDVDLSAMSGTMVYSEVYNMMSEPENYIGKKVRMEGLFSMVEGEGRNYFTCIITDAAACCSQGVEFSLKGDHKYPEDYPKLGDPITVVGVFETYKEGGNKYCQLKDAEFE